jgi:hypothetical protein
MAAVTQKVPNFLGGVSTQPDEVKNPGQVREILNGFPDPSTGLLKRQGTQFVAELKDASNAILTPSSGTTNGKWFSIFRDAAEQYIAVIRNGSILVWDALTGAPRTVTYDTGTAGYINSTTGNYEILSIYDKTFIVNKDKVVAKLADPSGVATDRNATIVLRSVEYSAKYTVTVNSSTYTLTTKNADDNLGPADPPKEILSADQVLTSLKTGIDGLSISGLTVTKLDNSLELVRTSGFTISVKGGQAGDAIEAFQFVVRSGGAGTSVSTLAKLPEKSINGRLVKVANFGGSDDDFFAKYIAADNTWEETISPTASPGLNPETMPHALVRNPNGTFTLKKVDWEPRLVGDDVTNDHPSLVGRTVDALFFHANRFGLLAGESVVMSQAGDYFNLYAQSALTQTDSDPIDINVSSVKPTKLHAVLPKTTGLLLFSSNQQFLLRASEGIYSPKTVTVNTVSSYENEVNVRPVDMGVTVGFLSKSKSFTRFFEMQLRAEDEPPVVNEVSKMVSEWIPETIDRMVSSAQNSLMALSQKTSKDVYTLRFYTENEERQIEAWAKWRMIGEVIHIDMYEDVLFIVTKQADRYWFQTIDLVQSPTTPQLVTPSGAKADPRLDMWSAPVSKVYNSSTKKTKVVLPYKSYSGLQGRVVVSNATNTLDVDQGLLFAPTLETDGSEWFYHIDGDFSGSDLVVGYAYNFEVELPKIYWRAGEGQTDFTASLTIARTKFSVGLSGDMVFELNVRGRSSWFDFDTYRRSDYYIANTVPFDVGSELVIPIHQRNNNYTLKVTSDTPYPVSLISMTWEGIYSPRYYRRS